MDIGTVIKTFRKRSGYYQEDLARKLGLTKQAICNWENGRTEPNLEMLYKLSKIFGVTVDELINGEYGEQLKTRNNQEYVFLSEFRNADETTVLELGGWKTTNIFKNTYRYALPENVDKAKQDATKLIKDLI